MISAYKKQILEWAQIIGNRFQVETISSKNTYLVDIFPERLDPQGGIQYKDKLHKLTIYRADMRITIRHRYKCYLCKSDKIMPCCIAVHINLDSDDCPKRIDVYDCRCAADDNDVYGTVWNENNDLQNSYTNDFTNAIPLLTYILEPVVHATEFEMGEYIAV